MKGFLSASFVREPRHVIAMLRLLVLLGVVMLGLGRPPADPFLFWFVAIVYGATTLGYLWARNRDYSLRRVKWVMFLFDVLLVSLLIVFRGEQVPSFVSAYLGIVLVAATVDGLGNAIVNAVLVAVVHTVLTRWGAPLTLTFETTSQLVFFLVISMFLGHVAESARKDAAERRRAEDARRETQRALQDTSTELQASSAQLQQARDTLQAQERLAALGMLSAGIAHEMRNPLAAMVGNLQEAPGLLDEVARDREAADDGAVDELRSIVRDCSAACDHLARIASDLTGMVREASGTGGTASVRVALESAARMLRVRAGDRVEVYVECATGRAVRAEPGHLLQVLLNLGGNGIDAMEGAEGLLTLRAEDDGPEGVALVVRDTGPGIPEAVLAHLYEPFFTTKPPGKGTGLGLHLVSEIVKASGGKIQCTTAAGQGTQFRVLLPAAPLADEGCDDGLEDLCERKRLDLSRDPPRGRRGDHPQGSRAHASQGAV